MADKITITYEQYERLKVCEALAIEYIEKHLSKLKGYDSKDFQKLVNRIEELYGSEFLR
jgi:hypothetical protein